MKSKYVKSFSNFSSIVNESMGDSNIITQEEKDMINRELRSIREINLISFYDGDNGFRIECLPDTDDNTNPIEIECEKEDGRIYLEFSQQSEYDGDGGDGFKIFPENIVTLEDAVSKIKDFLYGRYETN